MSPRQQEAIIIMLFAQAWKQSSRTLGRRVMTTGVPAEEASSAGLGALVAAVGTTFGTYMLADFLSNFIQHPTQLVSFCVCVLRCCEMVWVIALLYSTSSHHQACLCEKKHLSPDGLRVLQPISWS